LASVVWIPAATLNPRSSAGQAAGMTLERKGWIPPV